MKANGFTLVELLVGLTVMALLTTAVALTMRGGDSAVRSEASRFASRLAATRDQAIIDATPMGVWISPSGYGFERYADGQWEPFEARPLVQRNWAEGVVPSLDQAGAQRVRFDLVGLPASPATIVLEGDDKPVRVSVSATGEVAVR